MKGGFLTGSRLLYFRSLGMKKWAPILWTAAILPLLGQIQGLRDATDIGPRVGAVADEFSLPDQTGKQQSLRSLMGPQGLVLVFFRSADW